MLNQAEFIQCLKEFIKACKLEIRYLPGGHMGTTKYDLVLGYEGEELLRMPLGNDGFCDTARLGWNLQATCEKGK